ncbi:hypothetical protein JHK85_032417 [Glycine max]|nr:hypothetical protein JHK85_032417 [Glycine max]
MSSVYQIFFSIDNCYYLILFINNFGDGLSQFAQPTMTREENVILWRRHKISKLTISGDICLTKQAPNPLREFLHRKSSHFA